MPRTYVGTSGFAYKEWRGIFYPTSSKELSDKDFLPFYAARLACVEIDYTFYRMPNVSTLEKWRSSTPDGFKFTLKASQKITHFERLKLPSDSLEYLLSVVPTLGPRLGAMLYQLPPNFKCSIERLEAFLGQLPPTIPACFEFRNESWFVPEVYALLEKHGRGLVINDSDEGTTPIERTSPLVYLRLRRSVYGDTERDLWRDRIATWSKEGDVFAFIKHEENPDAPRIALEFAEGLSEPFAL
jgi:uncharacterized protein YecE (DUF72 family)